MMNDTTKLLPPWREPKWPEWLRTLVAFLVCTIAVGGLIALSTCVGGCTFPTGEQLHFIGQETAATRTANEKQVVLLEEIGKRAISADNKLFELLSETERANAATKTASDQAVLAKALNEIPKPKDPIEGFDWTSALLAIVALMFGSKTAQGAKALLTRMKNTKEGELI